MDELLARHGDDGGAAKLGQPGGFQHFCFGKGRRRAEVIGAKSVQLGPEPLIGAQRIVLRLDDRRLVLATDGLGPFAVERGEAGP